MFVLVPTPKELVPGLELDEVPAHPVLGCPVDQIAGMLEGRRALDAEVPVAIGGRVRDANVGADWVAKARNNLTAPTGPNPAEPHFVQIPVHGEQHAARVRPAEHHALAGRPDQDPIVRRAHTARRLGVQIRRQAHGEVGNLWAACP